ncbi:MAG: hypothetical protein AMJ84_00150 [Acidithiobacillales bacterium SM23_46]|nr:MAG: hypothetical protein AMJ84_00150 [Acidithiobacillales bacterium SM23_46]KPL29033.1 MAG: hypothetical protein AMJ72_00300 [Acidithiobacillales bacterium SM1_46]
MAYKSASLNQITPRVGTAEGAPGDPSGLGSAIHTYRSDDPVATVIAAAYVDDGYDKGVRVGDTVIVIDDNLGTIDLCLVTVVDISTNPAGDVTMINGT